MSDALSQMIEALGLEVAAIRKRGGGNQIELRGGERIGQVEGSWLYRFVVFEDLNLRDDTPVRVTAGQEDVSGILVSFREGVLLVALEKDLGPQIATARLVANDSFLIERLKERLEKVRSGEASFIRAAAERVLGLAAPGTADAEPDPLVLRDGGVNADQLRAVRRSLGSNTTYVWGPPGTGKTATLARIVEAHYRAGRSVLLVSNTNIAVDTAAERIAERLKGEPDFHQGLMIRQGLVVKPELQQRFGPQLILSEIVARLGESLRRERDHLTQEAAPLEAKARSLLAALKDLEQLADARQTCAARERERQRIQTELAARERTAEQRWANADRLRADLARAKAMGSVRRFFSGLNPEALEREAASAERAAQAAADAARALAADLPRFDAEIVALRAQVARLETDTRAYPPLAEIESRLRSLRQRLGQIRERISVIDREIGALEQEVLARCRILATTVYRTYLDKSTSRQFDAIVIDEASMLMPPLIFYVGGLAKQSVTVAGDFRQLPPIVTSDEKLAEEWLKRDVFEIAGIPQHLKRREPTPHLVPLGTQYRMCEPICAVVNELFYADHPLRSDPIVNRRGNRFPVASAPLLYVDTAPFHPWTALRVGTYSRYNLFHALLVRNIILHLAETGFLPPAGEPNNVVGAVAPYASQARLIQALLSDRLGPRAAGIAATVHRFQGNEKAAMVLDLTDSFGVPLSRFLKATQLEEDGARLLNVAASRAQHHMVLVANFEYLRARAPSNGFVRRFVDHFAQRGKALNLDDLLPLAERDWIDGLHRIFPLAFDFSEGATGAFTEGTFYPAFLKDLARTRESVVIFSPFATAPGTARWVDALRAALARDVRIRILTRPSEEWGGGGTAEVAKLVQELRELGVVVDLRARMHEKIAILDGRILWHGSLNILSHRDTHESMLRIESSAACSQLGRFVSTPGGFRDEARPLDARENPICPICGLPTVWNQGRYGIWFSCENTACTGRLSEGRRTRRAGGGVRTRAQDRAQSAHGAPRGVERPCPQPGCGGLLKVRTGRHGPFLGCTKYPACRYTQNLTDSGAGR